MPCSNEVLHQVPLFSLLDEEETSVLAAHVEVRSFAARQRIYKIGDQGDRAYVLVSGGVRVTTIDDDHQVVVVDQPTRGEFFGFASMLDGTPHQTNAIATEETVCVEVDRSDIEALLQRKPLAGMDMLTVLGHQYHMAHQLVRLRTARNPNEVMDRVRSEMDYDVNRRSEAEIQRLGETLHLLGDKVDDVSDLLRERAEDRRA